jgi:hypothetical protein
MYIADSTFDDPPLPVVILSPIFGPKICHLFSVCTICLPVHYSNLDAFCNDTSRSFVFHFVIQQEQNESQVNTLRRKFQLKRSGNRMYHD